jgi:predicted transcriptional regulator with HTH domain
MENIEDLVGQLPEGVQEEAKLFVSGLVEAEKNVGISKYSKKDGEVLKYKTVLKDLGYDADKFENVETFKESLIAQSTKAEAKEITLQELSDKFTNLAASHEELNTKYTNEVSTRVGKEKELSDSNIKGMLEKAIGDSLYGANALIENVLLKGSLTETADGIVDSEGNNFDTFISNLLDNNKDNVKSKQKPGFDNKVKPTKIESQHTSIIDGARAQMNVFK